MTSKDKPKDARYWRTLYNEREKVLKDYKKRNEELKEELQSLEAEVEITDAEIEAWTKICKEGIELAEELDEIPLMW